MAATQLLKAVLPAPVLDELRGWRTGSQHSRLAAVFGPVRVTLLRWCARFGPLSSFFYFACSRSFDREHQAVLAGRADYLEQLNRRGRTYYMLRRDTHRLEKGLLMRPRRPVFAADYIEDTVTCYAAFLEEGKGGLEEGEEGDREALAWTRDVLTHYFAVAGGHPAIDRARQRFLALGQARSDFPQRIPYDRAVAEHAIPDYDQLRTLAIRRRSVRWFLPEPVPRDKIDRAVEVASLSPSACNRLPFTYRIFDRPELVREVIPLAGGTAGYSHNVPVVVAVVGEMNAFFSEQDRHLIYIDGGLAAMAFCFALETQGLGSCCINWPDIAGRERAIARVLGLARHERVVMLIGLGYPDPSGQIAYSQKKPVPFLRSYNRLAGTAGERSQSA